MLLAHETKFTEGSTTPTSENSIPYKRRKGGGGKLKRCNIIQARVDDELHKAAEMMARSHRRTLSSFIEMLIEAEVKRNYYGVETVNT